MPETPPPEVSPEIVKLVKELRRAAYQDAVEANCHGYPETEADPAERALLDAIRELEERASRAREQCARCAVWTADGDLGDDGVCVDCANESWLAAASTPDTGSRE